MLEQTNPDLVYACYGINDGIYMPYSYWRARAFKNGMKDLRKTVRTAKANIIHLTPAYYDGAKSGNLAYIDTLDRYSKWLMDQREKGWEVADIYGTMGRYLKQRRLTEPNFALAGDAVHPNDTGHWLMAKTILLHLGARDIANAESAQQMVAVHPQGEKILNLVQKARRDDARCLAHRHRSQTPGDRQRLAHGRSKGEGGGDWQTNCRPPAVAVFTAVRWPPHERASVTEPVSVGGMSMLASRVVCSPVSQCESAAAPR